MKTLTILGRGPSWKECNVKTDNIWGTATCLVVEGLRDFKFDKVFAFDDPASILKASLEIAKERNIPIVSNRPYATEPYPTREIVKFFRSSFLRNTISYMMALAIYLKYDRIYMYGVDCGPGWFHATGKPFITYWMGQADARGVDLRLSPNSLKWAYRLGAQDVPEAFIDEQMELTVQEANKIKEMGFLKC